MTSNIAEKMQWNIIKELKIRERLSLAMFKDLQCFTDKSRCIQSCDTLHLQNSACLYNHWRLIANIPNKRFLILILILQNLTRYISILFTAIFTTGRVRNYLSLYPLFINMRRVRVVFVIFIFPFETPIRNRKIGAVKESTSEISSVRLFKMGKYQYNLLITPNVRDILWTIFREWEFQNICSFTAKKVQFYAPGKIFSDFF